MATLLMRPVDGGSADKKRRARKGKNAQKKQPQRGLGVAQLEKLRLQEQSLLCPPPSYSLRLCTPADHPMARCDSDVAQTILSLTNAQAGGSASTVVRGGEAGPVSRLTLGTGRSSTQSSSPCVVQDINNSNVECADASKRAIASRGIGRLSQSSKFPSSNGSFFSNVLTTTQLQMLDAQSQQAQKVEDRRSSENGNAPAYIFPTSSNVKEAANYIHDAGFRLYPAFKDHAQRIPVNLPDTHYLETLVGPDVPHLPRKRIELPLVGLSPSIERTVSTKELSSFQSSPGQQVWSSPDKVSGRKRPWLALQENARQVAHGQALDLNAPAGESDPVVHNERQTPRLNQPSENRAGAHYTTGIVRSALGNSSCLPLGKIKTGCSSPWQDSDSLSSVNATCFSDVGGMYPANGMTVRQCASQSSLKDRCSSATGSATNLTVNPRRCPNDTEIPSLVGKESICSNFLTLGLSSSSYPGNESWSEPEDSTQDNLLMDIDEGTRLKHSSTTSGCEGDDHASQLRKSACRQEVGVDLEGSQGFSLEYYGTGNKRPSSMLLCQNVLSSNHYNRFPTFPSVASNTMTSHGDQSPSLQSTNSTRIVGDILDLRLKLAL